MNKIKPSQPVLILLYGFPGSGKTYFARQLAEYLQIAHLQADRLRHELFEEPLFDTQENSLINHLMEYMAEEFLSAGVSVIYDTNALRLGQRRQLRELSKKHKASSLLLWMQIDADSSYARVKSRDKRKSDDKYALPLTSEKFANYIKQMQNPKNEEYLVMSGKHNFSTQRSIILKKMQEMNLVDISTVTSRTIMPELVNLVPGRINGRVDYSRRNITIK